MRTWFALALGVSCLLLTSCGSSKPKDLIVGKWERVHEDVKPGEDTEEFTKDGKAIHKVHDEVLIERSYTLSDDGTSLKYVFKDGRDATYKASVTKDELTLTSGDGNDVLKFKRAK
jgi:hypothetical protein